MVKAMQVANEAVVCNNCQRFFRFTSKKKIKIPAEQTRNNLHLGFTLSGKEKSCEIQNCVLEISKASLSALLCTVAGLCNRMFSASMT